ncbi:MAG: leucine--tRNA ligase [Limnohabitans sp.]|nr:leucine--tRNA ligase [Limnohabitans sp.]
MQEKFNPNEIERAVQTAWSARDAYRVTEDASKKKFYACSMLPYPSGKLHMGHVRNYTINDMLTRHLRMKGYNVLMPMGWDAFGLPAENAALKNGVPPAKWTYENIAYMKKQMQAMGLAIDWSREVATCDASYYKWNQWLFLKMLEKGVAYRKTQIVNWDPVDQTVLANEQVIDGKGWRTGAVVEKREIPGYYLKITDYAEELLSFVTGDKMPGWPERVKLMQENWIGKSEGVRFAFTHDIRDAQGDLIGDGRMYVFTTRPDTIMGVTFCAVAPEHPLATQAALSQPRLAAFIEECQKGGTTEAELALKEKEGMPTGLQVTHPLTGQKVDVWVGNYVLMTYGDGAVMGVPAHDERDFAFALKYQLPIQQVVSLSDANGPRPFDATQWQDWYAEKGAGVAVHSGPYNGKAFKDCVNAVAADLAAKGLGEKKTTWRLRDWGISRQRYWGTPIPIIHCDEHGAVPVPEKDLPVVLPQDCIPDGSGNPLNKHEGFHHGVTCPVCGKPARRETDTMDTFVDSSWYFMRYCDPTNDAKMVAEGAQYWMPMDQYIGGIEHAILHLLYARFWTKVMRDLGLVQVDEPFTRLLTQGMVLNHIYSRKGEKGGIEYFWPHEVEDLHDDSGKVTGARLKEAKGDLPAGTLVTYEGVGTMSKSKNNGVDPQDLIEKYGADTARLYTMFTAPPEATLEWNDSAVEGSSRFLRRVWNFAARHQEAIRQATGGNLSSATLGAQAVTLRREVHLVLKQVSYDYERMQYNTVVSGCMKLLNVLEDFKPDGSAGDNAVLCEGVSLLTRMLYPVCPHITDAIWVDLGFERAVGHLLDAPWPQVDEKALQRDEIELMLQVNGKLRGAILVPANASKDDIEKLAIASEPFQKQAQGAAPKKVIVVPGRLVNLVL